MERPGNKPLTLSKWRVFSRKIWSEINTIKMFLGLDSGSSEINATQVTNDYTARAYLSSNQTNITDTTLTKVQLDAVVTGTDPNGDFDTSNNEYVAPVAGKYRVSAVCTWLNTISGGRYDARIRVDTGGGFADALGSEVKWESANRSTSGIVIPSGILVLDAGDKVALYAYHSSGVATEDIYGAQIWTWMNIEFVSQV
jgi:hypothetical protein